jgi:hypothetical protein
MEQILINLIAGALGGVGAGKSSTNFDLGTVGNIISGLVGGGVLGQIITLLLPSVVAAAESGNLSIGGIVSQAIAGGAGGAILTWCNQEQSCCLTVDPISSDQKPFSSSDLILRQVRIDDLLGGHRGCRSKRGST